MRKHRRVEVLLTVLGLILLAGACHKKKVVAPPPPPPPPPPPAAPVCNLSAEPTTVEKGQSATLTWSSQNATDLDLEPTVGKVQASGSQSVTPDDSTTYTLTATGAGGNTSCNARVTVTQPPPPPPPPPPAGPSEEELFSQNMKTAYFDFDKSDIRPDAQQALQSDADFLKQHSDIKFTFEGNCDERGSEEYNLGLGQRRADAAKKFLVDNGISGDNISTISYGKDHPVCTEHNEECWQRNRNATPAYGTQPQPQH